MHLSGLFLKKPSILETVLKFFHSNLRRIFEMIIQYEEEA